MKKEALEVLKNRRAIRKFKPEQVSEEDLNAVLEAGTYGATGGGTQSPIIVAVQDVDTVVKLNIMNASALGDMQGKNLPAPYYGAPTILLVLVPTGAMTPMEDGCLVGGNLINAAYAVGLGSCWIHRSKQMFESDEGKELLKKWGLSENMMGVASIALGYPDCPHPEAAPRKEGYVVRV